MLKTVLVSVYVIILSLAANVFAVPGPAGTPDPANGATNVPIEKVSTWIAGSGAVSHDVYFGTDAAAVANAHRLVGDLNGNGRVDYNDLSILINYWLHNPAGSAPYAGVNDNNIVDFNDFALLANNWKNQSNPCFKGNTTSCSYDPNLAANTTYYWRIDEVGGSGTVQGNLWSFTTAAGGPEFTFVQVSDPQMDWGNCTPANPDIDNANWGVTISKVNNLNPDFLIVTGDLINTSSSATQATKYKSYKAALKPTIPCYEIPGNHDIGEPPTASKYTWWQNTFAASIDPDKTNPWYSFAYGDSFFIGLDDIVLRSPFGGKDVEEMNWLTQTLQDANAAGYAHKFVFMHVALFITSAGEAYNSADNMPIAPGNGRAYSNIRATLLSLFHQYGVKVVMAGHRHTNNYAVDGDLEMFTTTSCTCGLGSPRTTPGIRIFKVYSDHVEQEIRTLDSLP